MLTIDKVEALLIDIPTIRPHVLAMATMKKQSIVLVKLSFSDGTVGWGEATTIGGLSYGDESPEGIKLVLDQYVAPLISGSQFESVALTMAILNRNIVGNRFVKCGVETALFDALGKRLAVPISTLLGGHQRTALSVAWVLASGKLDTDLAEAEAMIEQRRHNIFKIKIGKRSVEDDVAHVASLKRALGDRASVRVDVNQHWNRTQAMKGVAMLADAGIDLIEQPLVAEDIIGASLLTQQSKVAIMSDEVLQGPKRALEVANAGAGHVFSIKIAQSGGLLEGKRVADIADASNLELYGGTMLESSIGTIASAQLFSTFPHLEWGTELFAPLLLTEQILTEPLEYRDFHLQLNLKPGLGIELDEDKVRFLARDA
jgi:muconate cycloisomerase